MFKEIFEFVLCPQLIKGANKMRTEKRKVDRNDFEVIGSDVVFEETERKCLPKMKTINEMVELTGLPYTFFRGLCVQNKIVYVKTGKKYLINYDRFVDYLNSGERS